MSEEMQNDIIAARALCVEFAKRRIYEPAEVVAAAKQAAANKEIPESVADLLAQAASFAEFSGDTLSEVLEEPENVVKTPSGGGSFFPSSMK